jgi:hypothetical protein
MKKHITHTLALFIGLIGLVLTAQAEDSKTIHPQRRVFRRAR